MLNELRRAFTMLFVMTLITGVAYPLLVTGISQVAFHAKANGSLIERDGKPVGSSLIGQSFADPKHFWGRPSATAPYPNNASRLERLQPGASQSRACRCRGGAHQGAARCRPGQYRAGAGRPGDGFSERTRPAHQSGRRGIPGQPRREGPQPGRNTQGSHGRWSRNCTEGRRTWMCRGGKGRDGVTKRGLKWRGAVECMQELDACTSATHRPTVRPSRRHGASRHGSWPLRQYPSRAAECSYRLSPRLPNGNESTCNDRRPARPRRTARPNPARDRTAPAAAG